MSTRLKVARVADVLPGAGIAVEVEGQAIAIFNVDGVFHAIENACPHRGAPLHNGKLQGQVVVCPYHQARIDVTTGELLNRSFYRVSSEHISSHRARTGSCEAQDSVSVNCFHVCIEGEDLVLQVGPLDSPNDAASTGRDDLSTK